jgi:hypothetical protein
VSQAVTGDTVVVAGGTYSMGSTGVTNLPGNDIDIHGDYASSTPPEIDSGVLNGVSILSSKTTIEYLKIVDTSGTAFAFAGARADRIMAVAAGTTGGTCYVKNGMLRNSLCVAKNAAGMAVRVEASGGAQTIKLRNVTAYDTTASSAGAISVYDSLTLPTYLLTVNLDNVIARNAGGTDVVASSAGAQVTVNLAHSSYATVTPGTNTSITSPGATGNLTVAPLFVDPTATGLDFREQPSSQTIDHGLANATDDGPLDLAGVARVQNGVEDMGAFEFVPASGGTTTTTTTAPPPPPTTTTTTTAPPPPTTTTSTTPPPPPTTTTTPTPGLPLPTISRAKLTHTRFRVGKKATAVSASVLGARIAARPAPIGTRFLFSLGASAKVRIVIARVKGGTTKGVGTITRANERQGAIAIVFSGRIGKRALKPGTYTATLIATNLGGQATPVVLRFKIVR